MPWSARGQAGGCSSRGQPADEQNFEQAARVIKINPEHQLDPRWRGNRGHDHQA
jgi:hypothetical protein